MLMPAAVLVVVVLGAFAVDAALAFLAQREVANLSAGIANDVAGAAVDDRAFYSHGVVRLDPARAWTVVERSLATYSPQYLGGLIVHELSFPEPDQVRVGVSATAEYVFSAALPSAPDRITVSGTSTAVVRQE